MPPAPPAAASSSSPKASFSKAARRLEPLDASLARETYLDALATAMFAGPFGTSGHLRDISQAALAAPAPFGPPRMFDLLLDGLSLVVTEGVIVGAPSLRRAIDLFPSEELSVDRGLQWGQLASLAALMLFDFESTTEIISHQSDRARRNGALAPLCFTLNSDVFVAAWRGDLANAVALAAEAADLTDMVGVRQSAMGAMIAAALSGNEPHSSTFIEAEIDLARSRGEGLAVQIGLWAAAVLNNGLGRYDRVVAPSLRLSEEEFEFFVFVTPWALLELIEAAVRTGDRALAVSTVDRLATVTDLNESAWARAALACSKALVSDSETAEEYFRESSAHFGRTSMRPEHARAHLLYGEWLRRQNRRVDARDELRQAYDMFSEMGMLAFAQRALHELQATGETVRKRRDDTRNDLTPQEDHIARLALEGRTNPEIGAQLYISARTVEWHLRKVFTKLNITSRRELRNALPARLRTGREK